MDIEEWEERAAIMEFDGGMTRFLAETAAARRQGHERWEVLHALRERDIAQARYRGSASVGDGAHHLSAVQCGPQEEDGSLPQRDVQA
jgi:hypothetical protein